MLKSNRQSEIAHLLSPVFVEIFFIYDFLPATDDMKNENHKFDVIQIQIFMPLSKQ